MQWTEERKALLRAMYPGHDTAVVARRLGCTERAVRVKACELKVRKRKEAKRTWTAHTKLPGNWGFASDPGKYTRGKPSPLRKPLGAEFVTARDETFVKVAMTGDKNRDWRRKVHVVWEKANGRALRPGEVVTFVDGDKFNFSPDNLQLRTQGDVVQSNSIHNLPKEIAMLYRAKGQITRAARRKMK